MLFDSSPVKPLPLANNQSGYAYTVKDMQALEAYLRCQQAAAPVAFAPFPEDKPDDVDAQTLAIFDEVCAVVQQHRGIGDPNSPARKIHPISGRFCRVTGLLKQRASWTRIIIDVDLEDKRIYLTVVQREGQYISPEWRAQLQGYFLHQLQDALCSSPAENKADQSCLVQYIGMQLDSVTREDRTNDGPLCFEIGRALSSDVCQLGFAAPFSYPEILLTNYQLTSQRAEQQRLAQNPHTMGLCDGLVAQVFGPLTDNKQDPFAFLSAEQAAHAIDKLFSAADKLTPDALQDLKTSLAGKLRQKISNLLDTKITKLNDQSIALFKQGLKESYNTLAISVLCELAQYQLFSSEVGVLTRLAFASDITVRDVDKPYDFEDFQSARLIRTILEKIPVEALKVLISGPPQPAGERAEEEREEGSAVVITTLNQFIDEFNKKYQVEGVDSLEGFDDKRLTTGSQLASWISALSEKVRRIVYYYLLEPSQQATGQVANSATNNLVLNAAGDVLAAHSRAARGNKQARPLDDPSSSASQTLYAVDKHYQAVMAAMSPVERQYFVNQQLLRGKHIELMRYVRNTKVAKLKKTFEFLQKLLLDRKHTGYILQALKQNTETAFQTLRRILPRPITEDFYQQTFGNPDNPRVSSIYDLLLYWFSQEATSEEWQKKYFFGKIVSFLDQLAVVEGRKLAAFFADPAVSKLFSDPTYNTGVSFEKIARGVYDTKREVLAEVERQVPNLLDKTLGSRGDRPVQVKNRRECIAEITARCCDGINEIQRLVALWQKKLVAKHQAVNQYYDSNPNYNQYLDRLAVDKVLSSLDRRLEYLGLVAINVVRHVEAYLLAYLELQIFNENLRELLADKSLSFAQRVKQLRLAADVQMLQKIMDVNLVALQQCLAPQAAAFAAQMLASAIVAGQDHIRRRYRKMVANQSALHRQWDPTLQAYSPRTVEAISTLYPVGFYLFGLSQLQNKYLQRIDPSALKYLERCFSLDAITGLDREMPIISDTRDIDGNRTITRQKAMPCVDPSGNLIAVGGQPKMITVKFEYTLPGRFAAARANPSSQSDFCTTLLNSSGRAVDQELDSEQQIVLQRMVIGNLNQENNIQGKHFHLGARSSSWIHVLLRAYAELGVDQKRISFDDPKQSAVQHRRRWFGLFGKSPIDEIFSDKNTSCAKSVTAFKQASERVHAHQTQADLPFGELEAELSTMPAMRIR